MSSGSMVGWPPSKEQFGENKSSTSENVQDNSRVGYFSWKSFASPIDLVLPLPSCPDIWMLFSLELQIVKFVSDMDGSIERFIVESGKQGSGEKKMFLTTLFRGK